MKLNQNNTFFQPYRIKDMSSFIRTEKARQSGLSWGTTYDPLYTLPECKDIIRRALSSLPE